MRVSTAEQNTARQLESIPLDRVYTDKLSGKSTERPQLQALLDYARDGDTIIVHSMDRLARNLDDLRRIVRELTDKGAAVEFVKEHLTFTGDDSPMSIMLMNIMGAFAEFERALIKERQREGIAIAKQKGLYKGRKPLLSGQQVNELRTRIENGESKAQLAREYKISRATLYAYLSETK